MPSLSFAHEFILPAGAVIDLDGHRVKLLDSVKAEIRFDVPIRMEVEKDCCCSMAHEGPCQSSRVTA